jgi:hypothetical protein
MRMTGGKKEQSERRRKKGIRVTEKKGIRM